MIISPCISICKTDPSTGYCYGCGRSNEEKRLWKLEETTDDWKKENIIEEFKKLRLEEKQRIKIENFEREEREKREAQEILARY